jgi:hypothetical protein
MECMICLFHTKYIDDRFEGGIVNDKQLSLFHAFVALALLR